MTKHEFEFSRFLKLHKNLWTDITGSNKDNNENIMTTKKISNTSDRNSNSNKKFMRDINNSLDEGKNSNIDITNKKISGNSESNKKWVAKKMHILGDSFAKHIKWWSLLNKVDQNHNIYLEFPSKKLKVWKITKSLVILKKPQLYTLSF